MNNVILFSICFMLILLVTDCTNSANLNTANFSSAEYFQKAYEAADKNNFRLAIRYYQAFQAHYPVDVERNAWAEFEIAFTYHKMGKNKQALELFDIFLEKYQDEGNTQLPAAPKVMAERVKAEILEKNN